MASNRTSVFQTGEVYEPGNSNSGSGGVLVDNGDNTYTYTPGDGSPAFTIDVTGTNTALTPAQVTQVTQQLDFSQLTTQQVTDLNQALDFSQLTAAQVTQLTQTIDFAQLSAAQITQLMSSLDFTQLSAAQFQDILQGVIDNGTAAQFEALCNAMGLGLVVSAGPDADPNNATSSQTLDLCSGTGDIVHFFSPDNSVLIAVTPGSAVVGIQLNPTVLAGLQSTAITGIDLQATGNPNEYTVVITWTDGDGNAQTTTDPTPIAVSGGTDLGYTPSPTDGTVTSSTGNDAAIPVVDATNAGLATPAMLASSHPDDDVETVTGTAVDNSDPRNPVVNFQTAAQTSVVDAGGNFAGGDVEAILAEIGAVITAGSDGVITGATVVGNDIVITRSVGANITLPVADITAAIQGLAAASVSVADAGNNYAGADLEAVLAEIATSLTGLANTAITGIDLQATANPNEYTVVVSWVDPGGSPQTTTDPTPITVSGGADLGYTPSPTGGTVTNSVGNDATIPVVSATNAGLATPAMLTNSHPDDDVESVTGTAVDNTDPRNPVINAEDWQNIDLSNGTESVALEKDSYYRKIFSGDAIWNLNSAALLPGNEFVVDTYDTNGLGGDITLNYAGGIYDYRLGTTTNLVTTMTVPQGSICRFQRQGGNAITLTNCFASKTSEDALNVAILGSDGRDYTMASITKAYCNSRLPIDTLSEPSGNGPATFVELGYSAQISHPCSEIELILYTGDLNNQTLGPLEIRDSGNNVLSTATNSFTFNSANSPVNAVYAFAAPFQFVAGERYILGWTVPSSTIGVRQLDTPNLCFPVDFGGDDPVVSGTPAIRIENGFYSEINHASEYFNPDGSTSKFIIQDCAGNVSEASSIDPSWTECNSLTSSLPSYADDAAAGAGGLSPGQQYQTDGTAAAPLNVPGIVMVKQ